MVPKLFPCLTDRLVVQQDHLLVLEVLGLLSAALLALGVLHLSAAHPEDPHGRDPGGLAHLYDDLPCYFVSAAVKSFVRLVENNIQRFHTLHHRHHGCLGIYPPTTWKYQVKRIKLFAMIDGKFDLDPLLDSVTNFHAVRNKEKMR